LVWRFGEGSAVSFGAGGLFAVVFSSG